VVATLEPETAAKIMQVITQLIARPPCTPPTSDRAKCTSRSEMPPDSIRLPDRMKNGIATSGNLSIETNSCCATTSIGEFVKNWTPSTDARPIEIATGTLSAISSRKVNRIAVVMGPTVQRVRRFNRTVYCWVSISPRLGSR